MLIMFPASDIQYRTVLASEITGTATATTALYYFWFYFTSLQSFPKFYPGFLKIVIYRVAQKNVPNFA